MYTTEQYKVLEAERDALKKQNNAYSALTKAQEARLTEYGSEKGKWLDAVATLDSEREANAILTRERDALAMQNQQLIAAAKGLMEWQVKNVNVWHNHAYDNMEFVISKSGDTEVIAKHDAGVLRSASQALENILLETDEIYATYQCIERIDRMIAELEKRND